MGDELFSDFVSKECDKVELIYTKFVSLISSEPIVQTLLPLTPQVGVPVMQDVLLAGVQAGCLHAGRWVLHISAVPCCVLSHK